MRSRYSGWVTATTQDASRLDAAFALPAEARARMIAGLT